MKFFHVARAGMPALAACTALVFMLSCSRPSIDGGREGVLRKNHASKLLSAKDYKGALSELKALLTRHPGDPEVLSMIGEAQWKLGNHREAVSNFESSLRINYSDYRTHMMLAQLLTEDGKTGRALTEFRLAARFSPDLALPHYNYGLALYRMGRKDDALREWSIDYKLESDNPTYVAAMGIINSGKDDGTALSYFEKAAYLGADSPGFNHNFGLLLERLGDHGRAEERFLAAVNGDPENISYKTSLAGFYMKTKSYSKAASIWEKLLHKDPNEPYYRFCLARSYLELKRYGEAEELLLSVINDWRSTGQKEMQEAGNSETTPMDQVLEVMALSCRGSGKIDKAREYMREAVSLDPGSTEHLNNYGVLLAESGMIKQALAQWKKVLEIDPENSAAKKYIRIFSE